MKAQINGGIWSDAQDRQNSLAVFSPSWLSEDSGAVRTIPQPCTHFQRIKVLLCGHWLWIHNSPGNLWGSRDHFLILPGQRGSLNTVVRGLPGNDWRLVLFLRPSSQLFRWASSPVQKRGKEARHASTHLWLQPLGGRGKRITPSSKPAKAARTEPLSQSVSQSKTNETDWLPPAVLKV